MIKVWRSRTDQRGLAPATELVVLVPALMILVGMIVVGARIYLTRSTVSEAAYSGARAASLQRTASQARRVGRSAATAELAAAGVRCRQQTVRIDVRGFRTPVGRPASVTGVVRCRIGFSDLLLPGLGGSMWLTGRASTPLDTYRER